MDDPNRRPLPRRWTAAALVAALTAVVPGFSTTTPASAAPDRASGTAASAEDALTLWYDEPAADWETQALPIGNGALGGMVFGRVAAETVQFNEKTLWTGGPGSAGGYHFGNRYLRTAPTTLGYLEQATFAAEVKVTSSGSYRRLFDFQPSGDPGTDGILIDLTPDNRLRFIGSGTGVTSNATIPTGRFVDLVVTMDDDGVIVVYLDGQPAGTAKVPDGGIVGCAIRELRFGADQGGGQRLTGEVDRMAILPEALPADQVSTWQARAFG